MSQSKNAKAKRAEKRASDPKVQAKARQHAIRDMKEAERRRALADEAFTKIHKGK